MGNERTKTTTTMFLIVCSSSEMTDPKPPKTELSPCFCCILCPSVVCSSGCCYLLAGAACVLNPTSCSFHQRQFLIWEFSPRIYGANEAMSSKSKVFLALSCVFSASMITYVQWTQVKEREDRRKTVERELQASEERRLANLEDLRQQQLLEAELRKLQSAD